MKHKKSEQILVPLLAFIFVLPILLSLYLVMQAHNLNFKKSIGEPAIDLLKTYEKGEAVLFYIDQSARLSLKEAIVDFANSSMDASCGQRYLGEISWGNKEIDCIPAYIQEEINEKITERFKTIFNSHMEAYPGKIPLSADDFNLELRLEENLNIIGVARTKLRIDIVNGEEIIIKKQSATDGIAGNSGRLHGYYYINPSFNEKIDFNLFYFIDVQNKARTLKEAFSSYDLLTEEIASDIVKSLDTLSDVSIGYCNSFTDKEKACMDNSQIPIFSDGKATGECISCNDIRISTLSSCENYYTRDFCNKDICKKNCISANNKCVGKDTVLKESQAIRICISSRYKEITYNENFKSYSVLPVSVKFSFNMTNDYWKKEECQKLPIFNDVLGTVALQDSNVCDENNIVELIEPGSFSIEKERHGPYCGKTGTSYEGYLLACHDCLNEKGNNGQDSLAEMYSYNCPYGCDTTTNECNTPDSCNEAPDETICARTITKDNKKCVPYYVFGLYTSCNECPQNCIILDYVNDNLKKENPCNCKVDCSLLNNNEGLCNNIIFNGFNTCMYYSGKCIQIYP
ncbi:MAG: hypothetical protein V1859_06100 [archaeon]